MKKINLNELQYPLGNFNYTATKTTPLKVTEAKTNEAIEKIKQLPKKLSKLITPLTAKELNYLHRLNGWTIKQLVHHLADSHMHSYIRFKLSLTENKPTIKPYLENEWANLEEVNKSKIDFSLMLLTGLHARWVVLLKSLKKSDWQRCFFHPEYKKEIPLQQNVFLYAWHGEHHLAHIQQALKLANDFSLVNEN